MTSTQLLDRYRSRAGRICDEIRELVEIESPSYDVNRSRRVADQIAEWATAISPDISVERYPAEGYGDHLVIRAFQGPAKPAMLLGHTDTVHPVGSNERNPTRIDGELFYGCGIFDMKANIVVALEALRYFVESGMHPKRPIKILLSCDEEVGSHSGRSIVEREAADAEYCLVMEPSADGKVKTGRKGTGMYTLCAHGLPAHAGLEPDKGANAIVELVGHIPAIHAFAGRNSGSTVNVNTIKGGTTSNVIPEFAECEIDVRFEKNAEGERIDAAIRALVPIDSRISLKLKGGINRPPMERTPDVVALFERARALAATFGYNLEETQVGGASDGNFVAALGIPIIDGLGISGAGAHMLTEHIKISDIAPRTTLVTLLLENL